MITGLDLLTVVQVIFQIVNLSLLAAAVLGIVFLVRFISKANRALDIWLEKNKGE